jgi:hypothetical protein
MMPHAHHPDGRGLSRLRRDISREDDFCPRCGAAQPWLPRVWHMVVFAAIAIAGSGAVAAPQWLMDWFRF